MLEQTPVLTENLVSLRTGLHVSREGFRGSLVGLHRPAELPTAAGNGDEGLAQKVGVSQYHAMYQILNTACRCAGRPQFTYSTIVAA